MKCYNRQVWLYLEAFNYNIYFQICQLTLCNGNALKIFFYQDTKLDQCEWNLQLYLFSVHLFARINRKPTLVHSKQPCLIPYFLKKEFENVGRNRLNLQSLLCANGRYAATKGYIMGMQWKKIFSAIPSLNASTENAKGVIHWCFLYQKERLISILLLCASHRCISSHSFSEDIK